jgi:ATP-binding cassette subfamily B protein
MQITGQRISLDLRLELFRHVQQLDLRFFDRNTVGGIMTRVISDVDAINELFTGGAITIVSDAVTLFGIAVVLTWMEWRLSVITAIVMLLLGLVIHWFRVNVREANRTMRSLLGQVNGFLEERLSGMSTVQLYGAEAQDRLAFAMINDAHYEASMRSYRCYRVLYPAIQAADAIAVALILWVGGGLSARHAITIGSLIAFVQYVQRFFKPVSELADKFGVLQGVVAPLERIFGLLDTPIETAVSPSPIDMRTGTIRFEDVTFAYVPGRPVLKGVSFEVQRGQRVGIVGATGAGKSTIVNLLLRFYDVDDGRITIDGQDIRNIDPRDLRAKFGLVLQDVYIFSGTIADNVRLGNSDISDQQVRAALDAVNAGRIIERVPGGLTSLVAERGTTLSAGERQLLSFARALVLDPAVLVLDEATSNVDSNTEHLIRGALGELMRDRTTLAIAHRLSTIRDMDMILVFHKGELCEVGRHEQLLEKRGIYYCLTEIQLSQSAARASAGLQG